MKMSLTENAASNGDDQINRPLASLTRGRSHSECMGCASTASAVGFTRMGAAVSIPGKAEAVERLSSFCR